MSSSSILLAHGAGGRLTGELTREAFLPAFDNPLLAPLSDAAVLPQLPPGRAAFTTDGFVVEPPIFPGGDLGYLSICGTVNDLAVAGAVPLWLTWALILEEGLPREELAVYVDGAARAADEAGVTIAAGDTKVVPRGSADRAYIVSAGLGVIPERRDVGDHRIAVGDALLVSGPIGDHGATVMACRHDLAGDRLRSDARPVSSLIAHLYAEGVDIHTMHDPTRGGVATACNETAERAEVRIVLDEEAIPVSPATAGACELLGLDPLYLACEGRVLLWVASEAADRALEALHAHPQGTSARRIGSVLPRTAGTVPLTLMTSFGIERPLDRLSGIDLPRIC